jgi:hypothetical protein
VVLMRIQLCWWVTYCRQVTVYQSVWYHTPEDLDNCLILLSGLSYRRRWGDNIKSDLKKFDWEDMDWTDLSQNMNMRQALVNAVMNLRCPQNSANLLNTSGTLFFSRTLLRGRSE